MRILLFSHLKQLAGKTELEWPVTGSLSSEELWARLLAECPSLAPYKPVVRLSKNWEYARPDETFIDADEVALIPPVSGG